MIRSGLAAIVLLGLAACHDPARNEGKVMIDPVAMQRTMDPCGADSLSHLLGRPLEMSDPDIPPPSPGKVRYVYPRDKDVVREEQRARRQRWAEKPQKKTPTVEPFSTRLNVEVDENRIITKVFCG